MVHNYMPDLGCRRSGASSPPRQNLPSLCCHARCTTGQIRTSSQLGRFSMMPFVLTCIAPFPSSCAAPRPWSPCSISLLVSHLEAFLRSVYRRTAAHGVWGRPSGLRPMLPAPSTGGSDIDGSLRGGLIDVDAASALPSASGASDCPDCRGSLRPSFMIAIRSLLFYPLPYWGLRPPTDLVLDVKLTR